MPNGGDRLCLAVVHMYSDTQLSLCAGQHAGAPLQPSNARERLRDIAAYLTPLASGHAPKRACSRARLTEGRSERREGAPNAQRDEFLQLRPVQAEQLAVVLDRRPTIVCLSGRVDLPLHCRTVQWF